MEWAIGGSPGLPARQEPGEVWIPALVHISPDGKRGSFDPAVDFVDFAGGAKKFTVRFDAASKMYWSLASVVLPQDLAANPARIRNALALVRSPNLRHWDTRCVLLRHPDTTRHGFQYVDWLSEGEDIIAVCRTAFDDEEGGAHSSHDANFLTFHRIRDFRTNLEPGPGR